MKPLPLNHTQSIGPTFEDRFLKGDVRVGYDIDKAIKKLNRVNQKERIRSTLADTKLGVSKAGRKRIKETRLGLDEPRC